MAEYVDKAVVVDMLRTKAELGRASGYGACYDNAAKMVELLPAADVAPVVRCKDCKWYSELVCGEGELLGSQGWCNEVMARPMPSNGFCNFGERE